MGGLTELCRRARDRAGAPVRGLRTIGDYMRHGTATAQPYLCTIHGHLITRLHRPQRTAIQAGQAARCPRWRCHGRLTPAPFERHGRILRAVLRQVAEVITCRGDGLDLIRTQIGGAPLAGGTAAHDDDFREPTS